MSPFLCTMTSRTMKSLVPVLGSSFPVSLVGRNLAPLRKHTRPFPSSFWTMLWIASLKGKHLLYSVMYKQSIFLPQRNCSLSPLNCVVRTWRWENTGVFSSHSYKLRKDWFEPSYMRWLPLSSVKICHECKNVFKPYADSNHFCLFRRYFRCQILW